MPSFDKGPFLERAAGTPAILGEPIYLIKKMLRNKRRSISGQEDFSFPHKSSAKVRGFIKTYFVFSWAYISTAGQRRSK